MTKTRLVPDWKRKAFLTFLMLGVWVAIFSTLIYRLVLMVI